MSGVSLMVFFLVTVVAKGIQYLCAKGNKFIHICRNVAFLLNYVFNIFYTILMIRKKSMAELNRLSVEEYKKIKKIPVIFMLDNIRSLNNIGSVFRTADAFWVQKIILCGITAKPPHRDIHKTALGATESVEWQYEKNIENALTQLKNDGWKIFAIEQTHQNIPLQDFNPDRGGKYVFIFGNEVKGVSEKALSIVDGSIEIPQYGTKHSLNISVSVGIIAWHINRIFC
jgi:23S rRNA (guanosine2251-2'-O)-methyltransferase